jgi:transmembrane sensor
MNLQEHEIRKMLDNYLKGEASENEKKILEQFFLEQEIEASKDTSPLAADVEERIRKNISMRIKPERKIHPAYWSLAAAVTAIILVSYIYFFSPSQTVEKPDAFETALINKATVKGQKLMLKLSDGTIVKLNSNSSIDFPQKFEKGKRKVALKGEAFFQVAHDASSPFVVTTEQGSTTVLGTSFNIKTSETTRVTLVEGKVNVTDLNQNKVTLKPNQQAILQRGNIDTASVDVDHFIAWKDDILQFRQAPLQEVIRQVEDWYGVDVQIKSSNVKGCLITARYDSESLENVLESLSFMLKGSYKKNGKQVEFSAKGCNVK